ncbi:MAG: aldo/keto reductase [Terriglobia bacterium]
MLNHTELRVSRLSFGTMSFGSQADQHAANRMTAQCLDAGINFFDTANMYNHGRAEDVLGKALRTRRRDVVLASKVRSKMGEAPDESGLSRAAILKAIEASLARLGTDYLDIYYLHWPDYAVPLEETLAALDELVRAGKVRYPGVSNYAAWQVCEMHSIAAQLGAKPPYISQPMYNLLARGIEDEYLPFAKHYGIAVIPYNPLAGGLLTGKHARQTKAKPGSRFDNNPLYLNRYWHDDYFDAVEALKGIARRAGKTLIALSLEWLLSQPQVDSAILGASNPEQLAQNLKSAPGGPLPADVLDACDKVWKRLRGITPKYNR